LYEQLPSFPASFSVLVAHDLVVVCSSALDRTLGQLVRPFLAVGTGRGRTYRPDKLIRYTHVRTNVRCPRACTLILVVRRMQRNSIMRLMMIVLDVRGRSASVRFRSAPADACPHLDGQNRRDRPAASMHARAKERKPAAAPPHRPPTPEDTKWLGAATWWSEDGRLLQPSLLRLHAAALAIGSTVTGRHPRRARRRRNQVCGHELTGLPARLPQSCNNDRDREREREIKGGSGCWSTRSRGGHVPLPLSICMLCPRVATPRPSQPYPRSKRLLSLSPLVRNVGSVLPPAKVHRTSWLTRA